MWEDLNTGKFHAVNNETGESVPCDSQGRTLPQFHHGVSGVASTKKRLGLTLKDTELQKSLLGPQPTRPPEPSAAIRAERVSTTGRFGRNTPSEAAIFLKAQRRLREDYPEIEEARLEEEAKARFKIDELHKNFYALQASTQAGGAVQETTTVREVKNLVKAEHLAFTSTGVYRP